MISALPTYIALAGFGFGEAAAVKMTAHISYKDNLSALTAYQSGWLVVTTATAAFYFIAMLGVMLVSLSGLIPSALILPIAVLGLYTLVAVQSGLWLSGYRCTMRYAEGTFINGLIALAEGLAVIGAALTGGDFLTAALYVLGARIIGHAVLYWNLHRKESWLHPGYRHASRSVVRELSKPALSSFGLMAADAASLQGLILVLGAVFGPGVAAVYASTRMLCRLPLQASDLMARATAPELTVASAVGDHRLFNKITSINVISAFVLAVPPLCILAVAGPALTSRLTGGSLHVGSLTFGFVALGTSFVAVRMALSQSLISVNEQHRYMPFYLLCAVASAASPIASTSYVHSLALTAGAVCAIEAILTGYVYSCFRSLKRSFTPIKAS